MDGEDDAPGERGAGFIDAQVDDQGRLVLIRDGCFFREVFNDQKLKNFVIHELQADEIRTFIQNKKYVIWLYTTMDVWSRLWITTKVGDHNKNHVKAVISDTLQRGKFKRRFFIHIGWF